MSVPRRLLLVAALTAALGCERTPEAPHGSPVLLQVAWEVDGAPTIVWNRDPDAGVAAQVPPGGSKIDFIFDRRLDGARVEDTIDDAPAPKTDPPITVGWPDMDTVMADPAFGANVFYSSLPVWGSGTTFTFVQPRLAGFPSGTPITFTLDPNGLTSVYGEPMDGPTTITVMTAPLQVTLPKGTATVPTSYLAPIVFSTRAPAKETLKAFVHLSANGTALSFEPAMDVSDTKRLYLSPGADCGGIWPPNARIDIAVDVGLPDAFGRPLMTAATGLFSTAQSGPAGVDGGCAIGDAGATDAPTGDAAGDAPIDGGADGASGDGAGDAPASDAPATDVPVSDGDGGAPDAGAPDAQSTN
ncbi:MAG TPA: hypothetical protein VIF57_11720 [Polyangia bacterium]